MAIAAALATPSAPVVAFESKQPQHSGRRPVPLPSSVIGEAPAATDDFFAPQVGLPPSHSRVQPWSAAYGRLRVRSRVL